MGTVASSHAESLIHLYQYLPAGNRMFLLMRFWCTRAVITFAKIMLAPFFAPTVFVRVDIRLNQTRRGTVILYIGSSATVMEYTCRGTYDGMVFVTFEAAGHHYLNTGRWRNVNKRWKKGTLWNQEEPWRKGDDCPGKILDQQTRLSKRPRKKREKGTRAKRSKIREDRGILDICEQT